MKVIYFYLFLLIAYNCGCRQKPKVVAVVTTHDYDQGVSFYDRHNDSAYYYFNKAATSSKDSLQIALAYNFMALIQSDAGDYYGSQESLLASLKYLDEQNPNDTNCLIADFNVLGRTSANLKDYNTAIIYYDRALRLINNDYSKVIALNNKAVAYEGQRKYAEAIAIYESIINQSKPEKKEYARILTNLAKARWSRDSNYKAGPELAEALQIRKAADDSWGLNSSYAHLADYYSHSRPDSALIYAQKMYAMAQQLNSPDDKLEALQKLIRLGATTSAKEYFLQYEQLSDSMQTIRNAAKNQFALIRYEAEKNKADILKLQKDNSEGKIQIIKQWIVIIAILALFIVSVLWSRAAIRENKLKTSQKVHDVVANGLYRIMTEIEHQDNVEKDLLLDEIEVLYEKSRNISYEQPTASSADFQEVVAGLLTSFANSETKVLLVGNNKIRWDSIPTPTKKEIEPILLELMVNMKKHSSARSVVVRFDTDEDALKIHYQDDGVGLPPALRYGNGLTNTENRIKGIGGQITFENNPEKGLTIKIFLPNAQIT